jgi:hypothetical protein
MIRLTWRCLLSSPSEYRKTIPQGHDIIIIGGMLELSRIMLNASRHLFPHSLLRRDLLDPSVLLLHF